MLNSRSLAILPLAILNNSITTPKAPSIIFVFAIGKKVNTKGKKKKLVAITVNIIRMIFLMMLLSIFYTIEYSDNYPIM